MSVVMVLFDVDIDYMKKRKLEYKTIFNETFLKKFSARALQKFP